LLTSQTESQDGLVILEPTSIKVQHGPPASVPSNEPLPDPYNLDHYIITSSEGFSPFEQNLGVAPFQDLHGESVWAAIAYTEDGGVHPAKVYSPLFSSLISGSSTS